MSAITNAQSISPNAMITFNGQPKTQREVAAYFLDTLFAAINYSIVGKEVSIPYNNGDAITVPFISPKLNATLSILKEGITPNAKNAQISTINVPLYDIGDWIPITDKAINQYHIPIEPAAVQELSVMCSNTCQSMMREALHSTQSIVKAKGGGTAGSSGMTSIGLKDIQIIENTFALNHVKTLTRLIGPSQETSVEPISPSYIMFASPNVVSDIKNLPTFVQSSKYSQPSQFPNEVGFISRTRVFQDDLNPEIKDISGDKIYTSYMCGAEALIYTGDANNDLGRGTGDMLPLNAQFIKKGLDVAGGPLEQFETIGLRCRFGAVLTDSRKCFMIQSTSAF